VLKLSKLMGALILAGFLQDAQDAQDVLEAPTGPAFRSQELEVGRLFGRGVGAGVGFLPST